VVDLVRRSPANVFMGISEGPAAPIFVVRRDVQLPAGESEIRCSLASLPLPRGRYFLWVGVFDKKHDLIPWHPAARFDVSGPDLQDAPRAIARLAPVHVDTAWEIAPR
jgi:ABC-2 type transport system ATP-binding protein